MYANRTIADTGTSYRFVVDMLGGLNAAHLGCLRELLCQHADFGGLRHVADELDELLSAPVSLSPNARAGTRQS